ncbi:helix-turn-helix transcriptional regulator [Myxococcus sp. K15C18031901]|uniref:helix-turn-helix transcriptional regulator n=1 Tax=Myxococcus dinghuensis TaxID=2906761 RepID=UPI0020A7B5BE|nr:helix-turn-helix transcriptional regulator [Myxococcus dinghuensis]MCP3098435.1 helix-turn-helix transcriptional regulator [Myxococcus dinghuensis]
MYLDAREVALRDKVIIALNSSLNLSVVLERVRGLLLELIPSDYLGLCVVTPGRPVEYTWHVPGPRVPLLEQYDADVMEADFVRKTLVHHVDQVMRDSEMVSRKELESSLLYQRSREQDLRLEQVMAVLMNVEPGVLGGFTLYRDRRRPFSEKAAEILASLLPHLANAVRNCHLMSMAEVGAQLLERLHDRPDSGYLIVDPPARERRRSRWATELLEKWFAQSDRHSSGLPEVVVDRLRALPQMTPEQQLKHSVWVLPHEDTYRVLKFIELPGQDGPRPWAVILHEASHAIPLPEEMRRHLTRREIEVAQSLLRNWEYSQIARELHMSPATLKVHIRNIFSVDKLHCKDRADFVFQAARLQKPM